MSGTTNQATIVERVTNAVRWSDDRFRLDNVLCCYTHVQTPRVSTIKREDGTVGEPRYEGLFILPKRTHFAAKELIKGRIDAVLKAKNGGNEINQNNWCLKNGDTQAKPFLKGMFTISAANRESSPPALRYRQERQAMDRARANSVFYDGCLVDVLLQLWFLPQLGQRAARVNANLLALRCVDDTYPRLATGRGGLSEEQIDGSFEYGEGDDAWADPDEL